MEDWKIKYIEDFAVYKRKRCKSEKHIRNNACWRFWYDTISIDYAADPVHFVVVAYDENDKFISIEEKPINPKRNFVFAGLYFCLEGVKIKAKEAKISSREVFGCFYG